VRSEAKPEKASRAPLMASVIDPPPLPSPTSGRASQPGGIIIGPAPRIASPAGCGNTQCAYDVCIFGIYVGCNHR